MKFIIGTGLKLAGSIGLVLSNGDTLQGTFLGFVEKNKSEDHSCPLHAKKEIKNCDEGEADDEFMLLRLECAYSIFPVGSRVAVNVNEILVIGPATGCAPAPAD